MAHENEPFKHNRSDVLCTKNLDLDPKFPTPRKPRAEHEQTTQDQDCASIHRKDKEALLDELTSDGRTEERGQRDGTHEEADGGAHGGVCCHDRDRCELKREDGL